MRYVSQVSQKVHFALEQAMPADTGSRSKVYPSFNLGARGWVADATPQSPYPRERDRILH
jgi:hypothetical protein